MNKVKRMVALSSMGLAAGAMLGAAPAQATPAAPGSTGSTVVSADPRFGSYEVGYFRREWRCYRAGFTGQQWGAWRRFDCYWSSRAGAWVLVVKRNYWRWDEWRGGWPKGWDDKPDRYGRPFQVRDDRGGDDNWRNGMGGDDMRGPGGNDLRGPGGNDLRGPGGNDLRGPGGNDDWRNGQGDDDMRGPGGGGKGGGGKGGGGKGGGGKGGGGGE
ncbi:hypothetical protein AB0F72_26620 [Actinoplanes sp. NPDC023936]|uniref:hypothetical protein n=1 Tax=Actinoplanes sp. NPDC023936 TaxID=3154910 RepID=UPI0033E46C33